MSIFGTENIKNKMVAYDIFHRYSVLRILEKNQSLCSNIVAFYRYVGSVAFG